MSTEQSSNEVTQAEPGQAPKTFQFINTTNSNQQIHEDDRFIVRTQVMKHFYQKKRRAEDEGGMPLAAGGPIKQQVKRFRLLPQGLQDLKDQSRSRRSGGAIPDVDPFPEPFLSGSQHDMPAADMNTGLLQNVEGPNRANHPDADAGDEGGWQFSEPWPYDIPRSMNEMPRTDINEDAARVMRNRRLPKGKGKALSTTQTRHSVLDLSASQFNPMAVLPDGAPPRTRMLIHHYCKYFQPFDTWIQLTTT
jgi:hypothetical protein